MLLYFCLCWLLFSICRAILRDLTCISPDCLLGSWSFLTVLYTPNKMSQKYISTCIQGRDSDQRENSVTVFPISLKILRDNFIASLQQIDIVVSHLSRSHLCLSNFLADQADSWSLLLLDLGQCDFVFSRETRSAKEKQFHTHVVQILKETLKQHRTWVPVFF